jgi:hypothetical protein
VRRTPAAVLASAACAMLAACGGSTSEALLPTAANVSACRAFTLTIDHNAPLHGLAMSLLSAGTSVAYRLRHDLAVFIAASKSGSSRAVADGMRVRADCRSIKAQLP